MTKCPDAISLEAYVDGEVCDEYPEIETHVAQCAACQLEVERLRRLNALLHDAEIGIVAPASLTSRLSASRPRRWAPTRRQAMFGGIAAAAVGVMFGTAALRDRQFLLAPAIIGDFKTGLDAGRSLDLYASDFGTLQQWYSSKADLTAPDLTQVAGVELNGGRLCWLLERRFLALEFEHDHYRYSLYLGSSGSLRLTDKAALPSATSAEVSLVSRDGITAGFWQSGSTAYALAGEPPRAAVLALAEAIRGEVRADAV